MVITNSFSTKFFLRWILQLTVKLVLKEWQFSDGSHSLNNFHLSTQQSLYGSSSFLPRTGRKIKITVKEGKDLNMRDKSGKCSPYVRLQYGKVHFFFLHNTCQCMNEDLGIFMKPELCNMTPCICLKLLFRPLRERERRML